MPEWQVYGCLNKDEEGASKREKIFHITNGTKFRADCELPIKMLHTRPYIETVIHWNRSQCGSTYF